ncbi:MAG: putative [LysW]-L-2-aminoadipate/[LysW]-L-glutamate phosphate reductase [Promethearchaeota archaeon]|nr:MAG: putative [LysW]-L-2-aminoadipate/[LysW]-L-glutamate phosphate reductase [Candidatus Lokiarchaeota archaeon]
MTINVGIVAASGYAGGEAVRLLSFHPRVNVSYITSRRLIGKYFHSIYPNVRKITDLKFEEYNVNTAKEKCDIIFLAVPHGVSQSYVPELLEVGVKVIDLSADFRLKDTMLYKKYYKKEHNHPELFERAVYGLPEIYRKKIQKADLIAVPGCQAASALYGLYPLIKENLIDEDKIIVDSKTGSSGSGASISEASHHPIRANSIRPYKMTGHRHTAEIEQELTFLKSEGSSSSNKVKVGFSAHAVNLVRGILSTSHVFYPNDADLSEGLLYRTYRKYFDEEPFIRLINQKTGVFRLPDPKIIIGTNYCDVGFQIDARLKRIVVLSALDNLIKGTAGNAVQCMNIICDFPETTGLELPGFFP